MKRSIIYIVSILLLPSAFLTAQLHHFEINTSGGSAITSQTAGIPLFIEVLAKDSMNATTPFSGTVDVFSTGILSAGSGTSSPFINGILQNHEVTYSNTGNFIISVVRTSGSETGTSNIFSVNPNAAARISVETAGDGTGNIVPAQSIAAGIPMYLYAVTRDTMNNFIENIPAESWELASVSGGILAGDLVPDPDMKSALFTGHTTGSAQIRATAAGLMSVYSGDITVVAGAAAALGFVQQPVDGFAGATITPPVSVRLNDMFGNSVSEAGAQVSLSLPPGDGTLTGTTLRVTNDSGFVFFDDLVIGEPGLKTIIAASPGLLNALSDTFFLTTHFITVLPSFDGSITPTGSVPVVHGAGQLFTFIPDPGYHVDSVIVDGVPQEGSASYTFINVISDHSIDVKFAVNTYSITASAGENGTISPSGPLIFNHGDDQIFMLIPDPGYHVDALFVDSVLAGTDTAYQFTNITADHTISVTFAPDIPLLNIKIFLEGAYAAGSMKTLLGSLIPLEQPYNRSPWNYGGAETVLSVPANVVDWIVLELRTGTGGSTMVERKAAFVSSDGAVVGPDGSGLVSFPGLPAGDYYVVIHHRNHLAVMSSVPLSLTPSSLPYDFTTAASRSYNGGAVSLPGARFGMRAGDSSHDGFIDSDDFVGPDNEMFKGGYRDSDHSLDGFIDSDDFITPDNNMFKGTEVPN